jgi:Fis family transcriptional regulator, factor for inversion stimulation protein
MLRAERGDGRMNDESTQTEPYQLTISEGHSTSPIRECLRHALDEYFDRLNGHDPTDLYEIVMREIEPPLLETTLKRTGGNQTKAAKYLGMNRSTLRKKLKQYGINGIN